MTVVVTSICCVFMYLLILDAEIIFPVLSLIKDIKFSKKGTLRICSLAMTSFNIMVL